MLEDYLKELKKVNILSPEEERRLWQSYKEGNDLQSRAFLIEAYQPLVFKIVMKMNPKEEILLDVLQEATIGLIEAVERFNHKKGINFPTYASFRIRGQVVNFLRKLDTNILSLDQSFDTDDDEGIALLEQLEDEKKEVVSFDKISWREPLKEAMDKLSVKERQILEGVFFKNKEPEEVANELNISLPHFYRLQKRAIRRIRGMLSRLRHKIKLEDKY